MIRRARLSFKPNVRPSGRSAGPGVRDGVSGSQPGESGDDHAVTAAGLEEAEQAIGGGRSTPCVADEGEAHRGSDIPEKSAAACIEDEPNKAAIAPLQRRKRISTLPNLAKPRVSSSAPVAPSQKPQQAESPPCLPVSSVPSKVEVSPPEKAKVPSSAKSQGSNSSPQGQHVTLPEKRTPIPQVPQFSPLKKTSLKQPETSSLKSEDVKQREELSPLKERPTQKSSTNEHKRVSSKKLVASGNLEKERIRRAQKLRELLKDELRKERKEWKAKHPVIADPENVERSKMVMRDFIYFIPESNPMTSSFAEMKSIEKAPTESQLSGTPIKSISNDEDDDLDEEEDEEQLLAPRVKVAEDGSIILDEESLTVEVSRSKAPIVEGNDPIFERGSTTTYSSFRKSNYSKPWSDEETDVFFLAISMVGTDFSMIGQLFPHRQRIEIKNKFKREERANSWRIDKAFREKETFDQEFFSQRLERALELAKKRRMTPKMRQPREKKAKKAKKPRKKEKDKAADDQVLSDGEMAILSDCEQDDSRTEEKENEGSAGVKDGLLPSDNVPEKKRRSRKKNNESKEPEEETCESLPEDSTLLPKKPRKKRAAEQVKDSELAVNDENPDPEVQAAPDTVQEKKKSRKKKSTDKEAKTENTGDGKINADPSPPRKRADEKSGDVDSLMISESGEPSFTQSDALSFAEESSVILFTEESECFSEPDDISSLQESVMPTSQTLEDQTGTFDDVLAETSQDDSVFETSHHLLDCGELEVSVKGSSRKDFICSAEKNVSSESSCLQAGDSAVHLAESAAAKEDSNEKPLPVRGRLVRPKPNLKRAPGKDKTLAPEQSSPKSDCQDCGEIAMEPCSVLLTPLSLSVEDKEALVKEKTERSISSQEECTKSTVKPSLVHNRLQRPKPNTMRMSRKEKCENMEDSKKCNEVSPEDAPKAVGSKFSSFIQSDAAFGNSEEHNNRMSTSERTSPNSAIMQDSCMPIKEMVSKPSVSVQEVISNPDTVLSPISKTKTKKSPIKPVRGQLQGPKPNLLKSCDDTAPSEMRTEEKANVNTEEDLEVEIDELSNLGKPTEFIKEVPSSDGSCGHQENHIKPAEMEQVLEQDSNLKVGVNLAENMQKSVVLTRGRLQRPKPNLGQALPKRGALSSSEDPRNESEAEVFAIKKESHGSEDYKRSSPTKPPLSRLQRPKPNLGQLTTRPSTSAPQKCDVHEEGKSREDNRSTSSMENSSQHDAEQTHMLANTDKEDSASTEEIPQPYILSPDAVVPGVDQMDSEKSALVSDSSSITFKKDLSASEDEKKMEPSQPTMTRSRLQKPKPNLGKSATRPAVSAVPKSNVCDKGKTAEDGNTLSIKKEEVGLDSITKPSRHVENKEGPNLTLTNDSAGGNREESAHTTIKPAQLRRGRLVRPVPSLGKSPNNRQNALQSKTVDEEAISHKNTNLEVLPNKRKASECFSDESPKRSCPSNVSKTSSDFSVDTVLSTGALDGCESSDVPEDNKQHSRFGRLLKRPLSTTPPILVKVSENVSDVPEKKTSRSVKSVKSKVKAASSRNKGKTSLVKIRAIMQDEDDEDDDLEFEDEDYDIAPDKLNQAPVFVPFSLRSPKPVPSEIEETVEELELPMEDLVVPICTSKSSLSPQNMSRHVAVSQPGSNDKGHCYGSTEAAMTLISMGNSAFQSKLGKPLDADQCTENQPSPNTDLKTASPVKICHDTLGLQEDEAMSASTDAQNNDLAVSDQNTEQSSHLLNVNVTLPLKQMSYPSIQEDTKQQDCSISDNLLEDGSSEETTFILTLVEIPISDGYPYSCDGNSVAVLPAPVLITPGSSQVFTQNENSGTPASSEPSSSESCPSGQGEPKLMRSPPSRKRSANVSSKEDEPQPYKKALLTSSSKQEEDHRPNTAAFEDEKSSNISAEMKTEETEESHHCSTDIASSTKGEKISECITDSGSLGTGEHVETSAATTYDSQSRLLPSSSSRLLPSSSCSTAQQKPGKKPLGFLSLVCKGKQSKKAKVTSKKNLSKSKTSQIQEPEEQNASRSHEDAPSSEVPSQSSSVPSTPTHIGTIPPSFHVSENLDVSESLESVTQESPKSKDLATEDEAATVSEYFFSDIFMEVDE